MDIEMVLRLVAQTIDGELFIYDDGYVIECKNPTLWLKGENQPWRLNQGAGDLEAVSGVKFLFGDDGAFETVQYC